MVEVESPIKSSHFLSVDLRMLTMPSLSPHCPGWLTKVRGSYALVPPHPEIVEALPGDGNMRSGWQELALSAVLETNIHHDKRYFSRNEIGQRPL